MKLNRLSVLSEDIKDLNFNELLQLAQDTSRVSIGNVTDDDVTFTLFTQTLEGGKTISAKQNDVDVNKLTKVIIHGWIANNRRSWYKDITELFLRNADCNVIQVDWEKPARAAYVSSAINTKLIGDKIAKFLTDTKIPPHNVHMVGHSLGAHIAGFAGKRVYQVTGTKISRITGLDPAGPYFQERIFVESERLDKEDADVVDVIHTDAGAYGVVFPIGTLDIYVNKGRAPQPGCAYDFSANSVGEFVENSFCSHSRSTAYFTEWINGGIFTCRMCRSWAYYVINLCPRTVKLAANDVNENITGICITTTRGVRPFLYH
ncbi:hypothetical protein NQ315_005112 [Exocentrus adspersus]|uniref:Lipase domain-containing protein n=1 Tax=Exocentrus adspersus TaxID=1586481 RepID=A0AAV8VU49_9CUCU|nr:hypothetical protein NQ315_005112 [Exocentrus adspersus]